MLARTVRIGRGRNAGYARGMIAVRSENDDAEAGNVDGIARMKNAVGMALNDLHVSVVLGGCIGSGLAVRSVIEELANLDTLDQLGNAAGMVDVVVRDKQVVDPLNASVVHRSDDAFRVTAIVPR